MTHIDGAAIYNVKEAAEAVGVSHWFIRDRIKAGALTAYRLGKRELKIKGADLQSWFDGQRIQLDDTASCEPSRDGSPSGIKTVAERAGASASRALRQ